MQLTPLLLRRGKKVRLGRWFSLTDKCAERRGALMPTLYILVHLGLRRGFWPSVERCPIIVGRDVARAEPLASRVEHDVKAAAAASSVSVHSNRDSVVSPHWQLVAHRRES